MLKRLSSLDTTQLEHLPPDLQPDPPRENGNDLLFLATFPDGRNVAREQLPVTQRKKMHLIPEILT